MLLLIHSVKISSDNMILPLILGYAIGKSMEKRRYAIVIGFILGAAMGLFSTYTLVPLLYPIFVGDAGLVVIPEFYSIGIMFLVPDFIIYTEIVYMLSRSYIIDLVFAVTGVVFVVLGTLLGSSHRTVRITTTFEDT